MGLEKRAPFFSLREGVFPWNPGPSLAADRHSTRLTSQPAFCMLVANGGIVSNSGPICDCNFVCIA